MSRDRDLFWKLVEPENLRARAYCRKLMGNRDDGDDLYQDSLVSALTSFRSLRDVKGFRPWLYRIIINAFKNHCRRSWWRKVVPLTPGIAAVLEGENPLRSHAIRRKLQVAFKALTPSERALVTLHELQGWGISELATLAGKSEGSIRTRLSRARRKMRNALIRFYRRSESSRLTEHLRSKEKTCVAQKPVKD
jgi:RNA polymerase sigma-70 factor (ECF subfamily)